MNKAQILEQLKGGLVVSCQALEDEPLHSSRIMSRMAYAAFLGGAVGIRANTPEDIREIKKAVPIPVIGLYKQVFSGYNVYITPTMQAAEDVIAVGSEIVAMDATNRPRPGCMQLDKLFTTLRQTYPEQLFMADCATYEEAVHAQELGFDIVGTTLRSYTEQTRGIPIPDYAILQKLSQTLDIPVIAEGGIWSPEQLRQAMDCGIWAAVIGTAITRPREITKHFISFLNKQ